MTKVKMSGDEVAKLGKAWYEDNIRSIVETNENIGKIVVIDVETGEYEVDDLGLDASRHLQAKRREAELYGIRIGYKSAEVLSAEVLGGVLERIAI